MGHAVMASSFSPQVPRRHGISPRTPLAVSTCRACPSCCWLSAVCKGLQALLPPPPRPPPPLSPLPPPPSLFPPPWLSSSGVEHPLCCPRCSWPCPLVSLQISCTISHSLPLCCFSSVLFSPCYMLGLQDAEENAACSICAFQVLNFKWVRQTGSS